MGRFGRRKRSSRTHADHEPRGDRTCRSIIFDREGDAVEGERTASRVVFLFVLLVGRTIHTVLLLPRRCDIVVGVDRGASSSGRSTTLAIAGARVGARGCPPASSTGSSYGDVDVLSPPGWMRSRRGSVRAHVHPRACLKRSRQLRPRTAPAHLFRAPPSLPSSRAMIGARASTACARSPRRSNPPPPRTPTHPASSAATADDAALDDSLEATPDAAAPDASADASADDPLPAL